LFFFALCFFVFFVVVGRGYFGELR
jgi:hypothetical protein